MNVLSTHRSIKQAKEHLYEIADDHGLCPKLLGLEKGDGHCFNYQLNKCAGACKDEEDAIRYNVRFIEAFANDQIKKWPFPGTIALIEDNGQTSDAHIVNNWCYLGTVSDNPKAKSINKEQKFDYDMYKIIKRFLSAKKADLKIKQFTEMDIPADTFEMPADII